MTLSRIEIREKKGKKVKPPKNARKSKLLALTALAMAISIILMAVGYLIPYTSNDSSGQSQLVNVNSSQYSLVKFIPPTNNTVTMKFSMPKSGMVHYIFYKLIMVYTLVGGTASEKFYYVSSGNATSGSIFQFESNNKLGYVLQLKSVQGGDFQVQVSTTSMSKNTYPFNPYLVIPGFVVLVTGFSIMVTFVGDKEEEEW